jgi:hypothetical protein
MAVTADTIYQMIKKYEGQFSPPAPYVTVSVGTFDVDQSAFNGLTTTSETDPEPLPHGPHDTPKNPQPHYAGEDWVSVTIDAHWRRTTTLTPAPKVPLNPVLLSFSVSRPAGAWSVSVNGVTSTAAPGQTTLAVDIWDSEVANWSIQAGAASHKDTIRIQHPAGAVVGAAVGAFTIPVLPVTVVYAPPADSLKQSAATYSQGQTVGTTVTTDWSTDTSHTASNPDTAYSDGATFKGFLDKLGVVVKAAGAPGVATVISTISDQIGQLSSTTTTGITDATELQLTLTETTTNAISTSAANGGPGVGDIVEFFHNLKMAWAYFNGKLRLCPLGYQTTVVTAAALKQQPSTIGVSPADAATLLGFDPFVSGGPAFALPTDRFVPRQTYEYGFGAKVHLTDTVTRATKLQTTHTSYTTNTDDWEAGPIFKFLGFGGKDQTTLKYSNATGNDVSTTVTLDTNLVSGPTDHFIVNLWYDNLLGTFAFQTEQPAASARLQGKGAQPNQEVRLTAGGRVFTTVADKNGAYSFFSRGIPKGNATITIGTLPPQPVVINS